MMKQLSLLFFSLAILANLTTSHVLAQNPSQGAGARSSGSSMTNNQTSSNIQITDHVARVNGLNMHYLRAGQGNKSDGERTRSNDRTTSDTAATKRRFTHHTATVNGVRLHYVMGGKGEPVVLLHGWPTTWYEWRRIMPKTESTPNAS